MKIAMVILAAGLLGMPATAAPAPQAEPATAKTDAKYQGAVRNYEPGNVLVVEIGDKRVKNYDLRDADTTYTIDPLIAKDRAVSITESHDSQGHKLVEVRLGKHDSRTAQ